MQPIIISRSGQTAINNKANNLSKSIHLTFIRSIAACMCVRHSVRVCKRVCLCKPQCICVAEGLCSVRQSPRIYSVGLGRMLFQIHFSSDPSFNFCNTLLILYQTHLWLSSLDLLHLLYTYIWKPCCQSKRAIALAMASCGSPGVTIAISFNDGAI